MDDIRPKGHVAVPCASCEPGWHFWVHCTDPRLPDGPFLCYEHDPRFPPEPCDGCGALFKPFRKEGQEMHPVFCKACWDLAHAKVGVGQPS